jgi:hypothetical protein
MSEILEWLSHHMPKVCSFCDHSTIRFRKTQIDLDKYLMHTYQASVKALVKGRSQVIKTEVRAENAQDARWLLWAQYGFHSIQSGPRQVNTR